MKTGLRSTADMTNEPITLKMFNGSGSIFGHCAIALSLLDGTNQFLNSTRTDEILFRVLLSLLQNLLGNFPTWRVQ